MKHFMKAIFSLAALAFLAAGSVQAGIEEKMVIALKTDDFELHGTIKLSSSEKKSLSKTDLPF